MKNDKVPLFPLFQDKETSPEIWVLYTNHPSFKLMGTYPNAKDGLEYLKEYVKSAYSDKECSLLSFNYPKPDTEQFAVDILLKDKIVTTFYFAKSTNQAVDWVVNSEEFKKILQQKISDIHDLIMHIENCSKRNPLWENLNSLSKVVSLLTQDDFCKSSYRDK